MLGDFLIFYCINVFTYFVLIAWPVWQHHLRLMKSMLTLPILVHWGACESVFVMHFSPFAVSPFRLSPLLSAHPTPPPSPPRNAWYSGRYPRPPVFTIYPIICLGSFISRNPPIFPINRMYTYICILHCEAIVLWILNKIQIPCH